EFRTGLGAPLQTEGQDRAGPLRQVLLGQLVRRVAFETGIGDPADLGMGLEKPRNGQSVLAVAFHPQRQRLEPLQEEEAIEGAQARSDVAQELGTGLYYVCRGAQRLDVP